MRKTRSVEVCVTEDIIKRCEVLYGRRVNGRVVLAMAVDDELVTGGSCGQFGTHLRVGHVADPSREHFVQLPDLDGVDMTQPFEVTLELPVDLLLKQWPTETVVIEPRIDENAAYVEEWMRSTGHEGNAETFMRAATAARGAVDWLIAKAAPVAEEVA